jgi:hypothetical protein
LIFALLGFHTAPPRVTAAASNSIPETPQTVFTNGASIAFGTGQPNNGTPYGPFINVFGVPSSLPSTPGAIKITINNFSHTFPNDVAFVLVGPTGASLLLQDGCGDDPDMVNVTYTISDDGATRLPDLGTWPAGTYRPTGYQAGESFPAPGPGTGYQHPGPAPGAGTATLASTFGGTNPNGVWNLYTRDFVNNDGGSITGGWSITIAAPTNHPVLDFDGDGKSDDAVTRNVGGNLTWYFLNGSGFSGFPFGLASSDLVVPGDYDGDGKWDVAVWRSGTFYILQSATNSLRTQPFGQPGDDPRSTQDYDGDGKADPTVVRTANGNLTFYILRSSLGFTGVEFGMGGFDVPLRGDYDGDGKADVAVYRKSSGSPANTFFILPSSGAPLIAKTFGIYDFDFIVPADFDGDHKTDFAVWRGASGGTDGNWYWLRSIDGGFRSQPFGIGGSDRPAVGDYDGDGISDQAIWRPGTTATFYHLGSSVGVTGANFGTTGDVPVANFQNR